MNVDMPHMNACSLHLSNTQSFGNRCNCENRQMVAMQDGTIPNCKNVGNVENESLEHCSDFTNCHARRVQRVWRERIRRR